MPHMLLEPTPELSDSIHEMADELPQQQKVVEFAYFRYSSHKAAMPADFTSPGWMTTR